MSTVIATTPLTADAFAPFGDVLEACGAPDKMINQGRCGRHHDLARLDFAEGAAGISIFNSDCVSFPVQVEMMERHPLGSQAFIPLSEHPFLVVVAHDNAGAPATPCAFVTSPGQGINLHRGTWHGVLTPLAGPGVFAVVDRIGAGDNLQEHWFDVAYTVSA